MNPIAQEKQVQKVRWICALTLVGLLVGIWANYPYLVVEHRRIESWKILGLLTGDIAGFYWFLRFSITHAGFGEPLTDVPRNAAHKELKRLVLIGVAALAFDLSFTVYLMLAERSGYAHGVLAEAEVVKIQEHKRPLATGYDLNCQFKDQFGQVWQTHLRVLASRQEFPTGLPVEMVRMLQSKGKDLGSIRIRYDSNFPARTWIDGVGWEDENGIYWVSISLIGLQAVVTLLFFFVPIPLFKNRILAMVVGRLQNDSIGR
ncbi:MAG: hypothetical protein U1F65_00840 [Verrucomicrobiota bacterium]